MKKSEKIEIRLSLAEKEILSKLASIENRTVSQLVRDVVNKYATLNMAPSRLHFFTLRIAGFLTIALIIGGMFGAAFIKYIQPTPTPTSYMVHGTIDNNAFGFPLYGTQGETHTIPIGDDGNNLLVHVISSLDETSEKVVELSICDTSVECEYGTMARLGIDGGAPSVLQSRDRNYAYIYIVVQPVIG